MVKQPYPTLGATVEAYAAHVAPDKVALNQQLDLPGVMGDRLGV